MTKTIYWARTGTGRVAHALTTPDGPVAVCLAMPLQTSPLWSPERTFRYFHSGEGDWITDLDARRCRNCERALAVEVPR